MVTIGGELNVRDRPIYLQFSDQCNYDFNSFWYVIEEKNVDLIMRTTKVEEILRVTDEIGELEVPRTNLLEDDDDDRNNSNIYPATDEIRELEVPCIKFPVHEDSIIVFNSRIYVLGGCFDRKFGDSSLRSISNIVFSYDTKTPGKNWFMGPTLNVRRSDQAVAALENSGIFVAFGMGRNSINEPLAEFLDVSLNGTWWMASPIPGPEHSQINKTRLLAVTDTKVYIHCAAYNRDCVGMGLSYDIQNSEWKIFDKNFDGWWSPGVVLDFNSNSYLFLFGQMTTEHEEFRVYDLNNCTWLPSSVEGLPQDGKILPIEEEYSDSASDTGDDDVGQKYLFRMNQENKLALVWSMQSYHGPGQCSTKIHCSKFNIRCTFGSDSQHPIFRAKVVSYGSFDVRKNIQLSNCVASLTGEDKKKFDLPKEWKEI